MAKSVWRKAAEIVDVPGRGRLWLGCCDVLADFANSGQISDAEYKVADARFRHWFRDEGSPFFHTGYWWNTPTAGRRHARVLALLFMEQLECDGQLKADISLLIPDNAQVRTQVEP